MGKVIRKTICILLSIVLVTSCLNLFAIKQFAHASQADNNKNIVCNTAKNDNIYGLGWNDPFETPVLGLIKALFLNTFTLPTDQVCEKVIDSFVGWLINKEEDPYKQIGPTFKDINQGVIDLQQEMEKVFNEFTLTQKRTEIQQTVNNTTTYLHGASVETGAIDQMLDYVSAYKSIDERPLDQTTKLNCKIDNLKDSAKMYDITNLGPDNALTKHFSQLWALVRDEISDSSLVGLYQACLKEVRDPDCARNIYDRIYYTLTCDLLSLNQLMLFANTAKIEQMNLAVSNWDSVKDADGLYEKKSLNYIKESLLKNGSSNPDYDGTLIKKSRSIMQERKDIIEKMLQVSFLEEETPRIEVVTDSKHEIHHSLAEAWVSAMSEKNSVISLYSDAIAYKTVHQKDIYGRTLRNMEDMTTSFVHDMPSQALLEKYFTEGNLKIPNDHNVTINLNGYSLGNKNFIRPALYCEKNVVLNIDGLPSNENACRRGNDGVECRVNDGAVPGRIDNVGRCSNDDAGRSGLGQIDGVILDADTVLNLSNTEVNNVIGVTEHVLQKKEEKKDKLSSATSSTDVISAQDIKNLKFEEYTGEIEKVIRKLSKKIDMGLISIDPKKRIYLPSAKVCVTQSRIASDDRNSLGQNFEGGINICYDYCDKDKNTSIVDVSETNFENLQTDGSGAAICAQCKLKVADCIFQNCESKKSDGGAINYDVSAYNIDLALQTPLEISNSSFCSNKAKNGGAVCGKGFIYFSDVNNFTDNKAEENGGAISNNGLTWVDEKLFERNKKKEGCTCFSNKSETYTKFVCNTAGNNGGAISTDVALDIKGLSTIENNKAANNGGAIYSYKSPNIKEKNSPKVMFESGQVMLVKNCAKNGGAIWSQRDVESDCMIVKENSAEENGAIFMGNDTTLSLNSDNTISNNYALRSCGGINGKLSVAGFVDISDNALKDTSGHTYQTSNSFIPECGLYIKDSVKASSKIHINVNSDNAFRITDDKSNESEKDKCKISWKNRLEDARNTISIDRSNQETKTACLKKGKHGLRHVYWLEG